MWVWWREKRIDFYIAAVIVPSVILAVLTLWALARQYNFINYQLQTADQTALTVSELFGSFSRVSIFSIAMVIFALLLILILGSYLSTHDVQRTLEVAKLKNDFVSTVSHELKTPLTSIRLLAERLLKLRPEETAKQREYHSLIFTQSYRLSHLIGNILDFSKLEQEGKQAYKFEKANLTKLIRQAIDDYPTKLIRADCKLEIDLAGDVPLFYFDKEAISRAFINLLDNALKFSPAQAVVRVACGRINNEVFVEVVDQGPGIDEEEKKKIFQRFYHTGSGTGLGLALVQRVVQGHKGRIEFDSKKGRGSKFRIVLPLKQRA
jgi:signal transduction histidine kinase